MTDSEDPAVPRAFTSYSWDSPEHADWVMQLATRLRGDGVDVVLDRWDAHLGSDLALFMERAADTSYRVLAIVSSRYTEKADKAEGGVGYERRVITPTLMRNLHGHRVIPVLRNNPEGVLPRFLGSAKYIDFRHEEAYEDKYYELLQELHGLQASPKPLLGKNPFSAVAAEEVAVALRHDPARYVMPALEGTVSFDYTNNDGRFVIGAGDREFTLHFSTAGPGSIYLYNDPADIETVALAAGVTEPGQIGDASSYDGSSRSRALSVGDAGVLRNKNGYWAAIFVDDVHTRRSSPTGQPMVTLRYVIPPVPSPDFAPSERS